MKIAATSGRRRQLIALTPLIDVVFILLFFFMLASSFERRGAVELVLSGGRSTTEPSQAAMTISIRRGGEVSWQDEWMTASQFLQRLATADVAEKLVLRPAVGTPTQDLVTVLEQVQQDGRHQVSLALVR